MADLRVVMDALTTATEQIAEKDRTINGLKAIAEAWEQQRDEARQQIAEKDREIEKWRDWMMNAAAALGRTAGSFYQDVPKHIKEMRQRLTEVEAEIAAERAVSLHDPVEQRAERYALEAADLTRRLTEVEAERDELRRALATLKQA